ncbi:hypothetical protein [uncultured Mobiluncus sp.]|nr:hypothetical protein [uncultured Mobiluncus sp.]
MSPRSAGELLASKIGVSIQLGLGTNPANGALESANNLQRNPL